MFLSFIFAAIFVAGIVAMIWPRSEETLNRRTMERLVEHYRADGHPNPRRGAEEHVAMLAHLHDFRLFASRRYIEGQTDLKELQKEFWSERAPGIQAVKGNHYAAVLKRTLFSTPEEDVYLGKARNIHFDKLDRERQRLLADIERHGDVKVEDSRSYVLRALRNAE